MIFYHTTPDPAAPFWLLHFESLTLAKLILHPGGPHVLEVQGDHPAPDLAFIELSAAIESMGAGFSNGLTMICHPGDPQAQQVTLRPLTGTGFATVILEHGCRGVSGERPRTENFSRSLAIGHLESGPIGPIWENRPDDSRYRRAYIARALRHATQATGINLDELCSDQCASNLWMELPATRGTPA